MTVAARMRIANFWLARLKRLSPLVCLSLAFLKAQSAQHGFSPSWFKWNSRFNAALGTGSDSFLKHHLS